MTSSGLDTCDFCGKHIDINPVDFLDADSIFCSEVCHTSAQDDQVVPNTTRKYKAQQKAIEGQVGDYNLQVGYNAPSSFSPRCPKCKGQQVIAILDENSRYCTTCRRHGLHPSR